MLPNVKCCTTPEIEVKIMMNMDVATVIRIGIFIANAIIGTKREPPPTPNSPEESPPKKLNVTPSKILVLNSNNELSERTSASRLVFLVSEGFELKKLNLKIMRREMASRKTPKIKPNNRASIIEVKYAPRKAPGTVAIAKIKPVL